MANDCAKSENAACEPPALAASWRRARRAGGKERSTVARRRSGVRRMSPRYRLILWIVIGLNGVMFVADMAAGLLAGSRSRPTRSISSRRHRHYG